MVRRCARTFVIWLFLAPLTGLVDATPASATVEIQKQWIGAPEFTGPEGIAADVFDNVFVVDQGDDRILKFDPQGALVAEWGSTGTAGGQFNDPTGIAVDTSGNVFVTDFTNNRVQEFDNSGGFRRAWGYGVATGASTFEVCLSTCQAGLSGSGDGEFFGPVAVATDQAGNVYVTDFFNNRVETFGATGSFLTKFGSLGNGDGQFNGPWGISVGLGLSPDVFVLDSGNHRVQKFDSTGTYALQWGTAGTAENQFGNAEGLTVAQFSGGDVYVADTSNQRVQEYDTSGNFVRMWGWGVKDGSGAPQVCMSSCQAGASGPADGQFADPYDIAVGSSGILVTDASNDRVQRFDFAGAFQSKAGTAGSDGSFSAPQDVAVDPSGNMYVADSTRDRIMQFSSGGKFLQAFGSPGSGNGQLLAPEGVAVAPSGSVLVADTGNNRIVEFTAYGTFSKTWGFGVLDGADAFQVCTSLMSCQAGLPGTGAGEFTQPSDVALDAGGDVFVADNGNDRIEKFDASLPNPSFTTSFGSLGTAELQFNGPRQIAIDPANGDVYVTEEGNNRVQELSIFGTFERMWGWGVTDGSPAFQICTGSCHAGISGSGDGQFHGPGGIAVDSMPDIYVADAQNNRIEVFRDSGAFVKKWGSAGSGPGQFQLPTGVLTGSGGTVYVDDEGNSRIQLFGETDTTAPDTTIDSGPKSFTKDTTPTFSFSSNESNVSFECLVDSAMEHSFFACSSPFTPPPLTEGSHFFDVRAYDAAGNVDQSPPYRYFPVDTTAPNTKITSGPSGPTRDRTPTFKFRSTEAHSTFTCSLDGRAFRKCSSPFTLKQLPFGPHVFKVRARDQAGNVDPTPAKRSFRVVP